jgi:hypothetical protein
MMLKSAETMAEPSKRDTHKTVNDALQARGRDASLRDGGGYFYFGGGEAVNWLVSSVMVKKISDLTSEQWLEKFDELLAQDQKLRQKGPTKSKPKSKR